jgi:hypothetical protein
MEKCGWCHQYPHATGIDRLDNISDQAHIMVVGQPTYANRVTISAKFSPDKFRICQDIAMAQRYAPRGTRRSGSVLQQGQVRRMNSRLMPACRQL